MSSNQQSPDQYVTVQYSGGQRTMQKESDWDNRDLQPPEPPGGRYDLWDLQWCKWWGWTWIRKPEGGQPAVVMDPARCSWAGLQTGYSGDYKTSRPKKAPKKKKGFCATFCPCCLCRKSKCSRRTPSEYFGSHRKHHPAGNNHPPAGFFSGGVGYQSSGMEPRMEHANLCCECKFAMQNPAGLCSACGQPIPPTSTISPPPFNQTTIVPQTTPPASPSPSAVPPPTQGGCSRCQMPLCCACQAREAAVPQSLCQCGRLACPTPICQCSLKNKPQETPQTINMVKVYENNPYLTEMIKLKAFACANAQKPFNLLMRNNYRLMKLLTEKSSNFSTSGNLPNPIDTSFTPDSAVKMPLDDLQRKDHEHCKILTAVCDAILANHSNDQFINVLENLHELKKESFSRSEISKDASVQSEVVTFEELSDEEVQTEITRSKKKDLSEVRRRKKELPDVHITTSNRTVILDEHIYADVAGSIAKRRTRKSSEQSTSYPKVLHSKKQHPDWNRIYHSKCKQLRKQRPESTNLDTSLMTRCESSYN